MSDHKPITGELRRNMVTDETCSKERLVYYLRIDEVVFVNLCDRIDAIHAQLERENVALKVELDRVLGEKDEHAHARGESITDELREWFKDRIFMANGWQEIRDIADRIDAEHQKAIRELNNFADASVLLPVDADGETIHVGDMMERGEARGHVIALMLSNYPKKWGGGLHWGVQLEGEQAPTALDLTFHHYHKPTVEDVLREMHAELDEVTALYVGEAIDSDERDHDEARIFAEYAAKLRLAGDAE